MPHPTLLIWGSHDKHGPVATGRRMVATMPDARLEILGTGDLCPGWMIRPAAPLSYENSWVPTRTESQATTVCLATLVPTQARRTRLGG